MQLLPPPQRVPLVISSDKLARVTPCIVALEKITCHYVAAVLSVGSTRELDAVHTWVCTIIPFVTCTSCIKQLRHCITVSLN